MVKVARFSGVLGHQIISGTESKECYRKILLQVGASQIWTNYSQLKTKLLL